MSYLTYTQGISEIPPSSAAMTHDHSGGEDPLILEQPSASAALEPSTVVGVQAEEPTSHPPGNEVPMRCPTLRSLLPFALLVLGTALPASLHAQTSPSTAGASLPGPRVAASDVTWGIAPPASDFIPLPQTRRSHSVARGGLGHRRRWRDADRRRRGGDWTLRVVPVPQVDVSPVTGPVDRADCGSG
jgi:hypothetical protein